MTTDAINLPPLPEPAEWALQIAAQAWCEPTTSGKVMDAELATVFAQQLTRLASYEATRPAQPLADRVARAVVAPAESTEARMLGLRHFGEN